VDIDFDMDMSTLDLTGVELEAPVDIDWGDLEGDDGAENVDDKIDWDAVDIVSEVQVNWFTNISVIFFEHDIHQH
jgi:hypothetical protein